MMGEPIEQDGRHRSIAEHTGPFAETEAGGDDDADLFVTPEEQVEHERGA